MAFKGIVVVDCTHVLAGPFCTYALALLGADVIKIESPDRPDCARGRGPNAELNAAGMGLTYQVQASGKKSLALDLRSDEGKRIFFLLLLKADVLVVNYLHLPVQEAEIRARNPRLIFCSITGFGTNCVPAFDNTIQASSGTISQCNGVKPGVSFVDYSAGFAAAFAISAALFQRERDGKGNSISCSMFETAIGLMAPEAAATRHQVDTASRPKKEAGLGTFVASDGRHVTLGVFTPEQTNRFWSELRKDGMTTEEFHVSMDWPDLWAQSDAMSKVLPEIFARFHTAEGWQAWCLQRHLPCSVVRTLAEACCDPLLTERGYWHRSSENVLLPTVPFHMESGRCVDLCGPPELGQNTEQILDWLKN